MDHRKDLPREITSSDPFGAGVSLVIATYRRRDRIAPTLQSALRQSVPFAEIVVVDDCSPDDSAEWISQNFPQVRVVRTPANRMTSGARNFGATAARSPWLMFLDHDDLLLPHALNTFRDLAAALPEASSLHADHTYENLTTGEIHPDHHSSIPAFGRFRKIRTVRSNASGRLYGRELFYALLRGNLLQQPWMIRKSVFSAIGGFREDVRYCEDWEFYTRIAHRHLIAVTDRVVSRHIIEGENLHLVEGQESMHKKVLGIRLSEHPFDRHVQWICRRRLGAYAKLDGDRSMEASDARAAWRHYLRAFGWWPFDHVVGARCLMWLPGALRDKRTR